MTDPKSRVQLAQELLSGGLPLLAAAVVDLRETVYNLKRETQLHPIAMANHMGVIRPAHPAPTSSPGGDKPSVLLEAANARVLFLEAQLNTERSEGDSWRRVAERLEREKSSALSKLCSVCGGRGRVSVPIKNEAGEDDDTEVSCESCGGATAAEWASRYADEVNMAKTWKSEFEREEKAAREGRVEVSRLKAALKAIRELLSSAGCSDPGEDCGDRTLCMVEELRQRTVCTESHREDQAELTRLKEANAALSCKWVTVEQFADEKAAHEVTRRELHSLQEYTTEWETGERRRLCAVVEAARCVIRSAATRTAVTPSLFTVNVLENALSALDRTEGEQAEDASGGQ